MHLFQLGTFSLASGDTSKWKIECDALTDNDLKALAYMISQLVGPFSSVEGVPTGGLRLADAINPYKGLEGPHLIVDDVLTTGSTIEKLKSNYTGNKYIVGAVIFARGICPEWVKPLFQMSKQ